MAWAKRLVVFVLGVILLIDTVFFQFRTVQFIISLIMIGIVPIDYLIDLATRPERDEGEIDRLREVMQEHDKE
jgi:hypothetical protein